ncbi:MAG: S-layer homology domain-containing protein, partial [Candidatus Gracilibacteria bacterium]|nr:S-layer homology domain-containing protein [Candidatus Gracilibacteria bacterium]
VDISTPEGKAAAAGITVSELNSGVSHYSDIRAAHWAAGFLSRLTRDSVLAGYPDGTIKPDTTINRAELAKIATLAFDLTTATETFTDVNSLDWFAPYIGALQHAGASYSNMSRYYPAMGVSRAEAVWVLLSAAGITSINTPPTTKLFPDVATSNIYAGAITYAANNGIISGYENGNFGPTDTLTRAQVAKIVVLIKQKLE